MDEGKQAQPPKSVVERKAEDAARKQKEREEAKKRQRDGSFIDERDGKKAKTDTNTDTPCPTAPVDEKDQEKDVPGLDQEEEVLRNDEEKDVLGKDVEKDGKDEETEPAEAQDDTSSDDEDVGKEPFEAQAGPSSDEEDVETDDEKKPSYPTNHIVLAVLCSKEIEHWLVKKYGASNGRGLHNCYESACRVQKGSAGHPFSPELYAEVVHFLSNRNPIIHDHGIDELADEDLFIDIFEAILGKLGIECPFQKGGIAPVVDSTKSVAGGEEQYKRSMKIMAKRISQLKMEIGQFKDTIAKQKKKIAQLQFDDYSKKKQLLDSQAREIGQLRNALRGAEDQLQKKDRQLQDRDHQLSWFWHWFPRARIPGDPPSRWQPYHPRYPPPPPPHPH